MTMRAISGLLLANGVGQSMGVFTPQCAEDDAWTYVLHYRDDPNVDDIPNTIQDVAAGFETTNAKFIGIDALQNVDFDIAQICVGSTNGCSLTCETIDDTMTFPCYCAAAGALDTPVKRFLASMAGICQAGAECVWADSLVRAKVNRFSREGVWQCLPTTSAWAPEGAVGDQTGGIFAVPSADWVNPAVQYNLHRISWGFTMSPFEAGREFGIANSPGSCSQVNGYSTAVDVYQIRVHSTATTTTSISVTTTSATTSTQTVTNTTTPDPVFLDHAPREHSELFWYALAAALGSVIG